jgi:hypothetical protein
VLVAKIRWLNHFLSERRWFSDRMICINWNVAAVQPKPRPSNKNKTTVPSRSSNQWPAKPGRTIINATTIIRVAQAYARAMGDRSSGGVVTGAARSACVWAIAPTVV